MEHLEKIASEIELKDISKAKEFEQFSSENYSVVSESYVGLELLEDNRYAGGTSIKYWM